MQKAITVALLLGWLTLSARSSEGAEVEQAIAVLENSCRSGARSEALFTLRDAKATAAPAAPVLGRIIASCPTSAEASHAAEILSHCGSATIPILVELVQNDFESCLMVRRILMRMPRGDVTKSVAALRGLCRSNPQSFYSLSPLIRVGGLVSTSEFAHEILKRYPATPVHSVAYLAAATRDDSLCEVIESREGPLAAYLAASIREGWREQDWPRTVTGELPAAEEERRQRAQAELRRLARPALPELLKSFHQGIPDGELYLKLGILEELSRHTELASQQVNEALADVSWQKQARQQDHQSLLEVLLHRYADQSLAPSKGGRGGPRGGMGGDGVRRYDPSYSFWSL